MKKEVEVFESCILEKGLKHSEQRLKILDIISRSAGHLTAEDIFRKVKNKIPKIGQATVYRTLKLLSECGLCREVRIDDGVVRYEMLYGQKHHDHLICTKCGKFEEVVDEKIEKLQDKLAKDKGFVLVNHRLVLYGLCPECK